MRYLVCRRADEVGQMFKFVAADIIHPPLFYALLKVWIGIGGESLLCVALLPVILSTAALVPVVLLCRELNFEQTKST